MAHISVTAKNSRRIVTVQGDLTAADLQRLERACGPALERQSPELELVIRNGVIGDSAAQAYVARLRARGVVVQLRDRWR
jgi:hypothetical protein